jgi:hypothetical protein
VAGLPQEYIAGQTPFVTEVYTFPNVGQEDVMGLVHLMPGWLWGLLTGPAAHYGMLLKHVEVTNDWGVVGEVLWFWQLEHHLSDLHLQIAHLEAKFRGVAQAQSAAKGRLELAHLDFFAADLCVLSSPKSQAEGGRNNRFHNNNKQWQGMEPF